MKRVMKWVGLGFLVMVMVVLGVGWLSSVSDDESVETLQRATKWKFNDSGVEFWVGVEMRTFGNSVAEEVTEDYCGLVGLRIAAVSPELLLLIHSYPGFAPMANLVAEPVMPGDLVFFEDEGGRLKMAVIRSASGQADEALVRLGKVTEGLKELEEAAIRFDNDTEGAVVVECH